MDEMSRGIKGRGTLKGLVYEGRMIEVGDHSNTGRKSVAWGADRADGAGISPWGSIWGLPSLAVGQENKYYCGGDPQEFG